MYSQTESRRQSVGGDLWLDSAIQVGRLVMAAGKLAPFPYIKGCARMVVTLLESLQMS